MREKAREREKEKRMKGKRERERETYVRTLIQGTKTERAAERVKKKKKRE